MMIAASSLTLALLCLTTSSNAFVTQQSATRGAPLASLVMDRTDVFRPASTHPDTYLPGAPTSSHGIGYGVSSYGPSSYGYGYGYNNNYDNYNRYGYNNKYSNYDNYRSVNDRTYSSSYYPYSRYGSSYGNNWDSGRRYNTLGSNYAYNGRSSYDNDLYGRYNNYNTYNNRNYYNNNDYYNGRYNNGYGSSYGSYGPYSNNYRSGSYGYGYNNDNNYYNNWNTSSRNYNNGRNWYDMKLDRQGAFEAGSTHSAYSRPSRTSQQLSGYYNNYNNGYLSADQPRAFSPGYNWRK